MRHILALSFLLPSLFIPAAANAMMPVDDASASAPEVRVSTGVTAPSLLDSNPTLRFNSFEAPIFGDSRVGLTLTVDENGHPENIQVVKSLSPLWDARVVEAVSHFHYRPGSVDGQPIPVDVNMTVNIAK